MEVHLQSSSGDEQRVNVHEAKTNLSKLLERVAAGERIVVCRAGTPIADLIPHERPRVRRVFGRYKGIIGEFNEAAWAAADAEILQDFEDSIDEPLDL